MPVTTTARSLGVVGALVAAYAHVSLYRAGYADIPIAHIGTQFLLNAAGGIAIAVGLITPMFVASLPRWTTRATALLGIGWAAMSLVAYVLSHSDRGWMGYRDGPDFLFPSPEGAMSVFGEVAVLVASVVLLVAGGRTAAPAPATAQI